MNLPSEPPCYPRKLCLRNTINSSDNDRILRVLGYVVLLCDPDVCQARPGVERVDTYNF